MPQRLKTRCRFRGCPQLVRGAYCPEHASEAYRRPVDRRRGTPAERGYDATWAAVARWRRRLDKHLCQPCNASGRLTPSKTVDHIVPLHVRPGWRREIGNTQVICPSCPGLKTAADSARYGSSTQERLSEGQQAARAEARLMCVPPRGGE